MKLQYKGWENMNRWKNFFSSLQAYYYYFGASGLGRELDGFSDH